MRILIALNENKGIDSELSGHFGHCPYFATYETETKNLEIVTNEIDHSKQDLTPVDQVMRFNPDAVFSLGMGQRAIKLFNEKNVKVKTGNYPNLKEVIENIDSLKDLENGCSH